MVGRAAIILRAKEDEMDRCSGCGGSLTTAGCNTPACMSGPGGYYRDGVKVAPAAGPPPPLVLPSPADVRARIAALSDDEVITLWGLLRKMSPDGR